MPRFLLAMAASIAVGFVASWWFMRMARDGALAQALGGIPGNLDGLFRPLLLAGPWLVFLFVASLPILLVRARRRRLVFEIEQDLPITLELACLSLLLAVTIALPAGVVAAVRRNTGWDLLASGLSLGGLSVPNFWLGIMLVLLLSVRLGWLPASGHVPFTADPFGNLQRMLMPAFVLGTGLAAVLMRQVRNSMIEVLATDYIRTARSKGLAQPAVVLRHAVRNGLIPVVTIMGLQLGMLMSGAVVTEQIFVIPGFGRLIVEAVFTRDYPLVQGVVLVTASAYVLVNLLVDASYTLLNPRIRVQGTASGA